MRTWRRRRRQKWCRKIQRRSLSGRPSKPPNTPEGTAILVYFRLTLLFSRISRAADLSEKKKHIPVIDRTPLEPPPVVVAIVGPTKVGKSTLMRNLLRHYCRQTPSDIKGPVTVVSGKHRRLTLIECRNDLNSMIDVAKVADLVRFFVLYLC